MKLYVYVKVVPLKKTKSNDHALSKMKTQRLYPPLATVTEFFEGGICVVSYPVVTVNHAAIAAENGYAAMLGQAHDEGRTDALDAGITADRFPVAGDGLVLIQPALLSFCESKVSSEAVRLFAESLETDGAPWSVGGLAELCALTGAHPWLQHRDPILALGSAADGDGYVKVAPRACSCPGPNSGRLLDLYASNEQGLWPAYCTQFLIVRQAS